jgi:hypothetical protein
LAELYNVDLLFSVMYFSLLIFIIFFYTYQVEEKEEIIIAETKEEEVIADEQKKVEVHVIAEVDTGSDDEVLGQAAAQQPWCC